MQALADMSFLRFLLRCSAEENNNSNNSQACMHVNTAYYKKHAISKFERTRRKNLPFRVPCLRYLHCSAVRRLKHSSCTRKRDDRVTIIGFHPNLLTSTIYLSAKRRDTALVFFHSNTPRPAGSYRRGADGV